MRGGRGGEKVQVAFGILGEGKRYPDSGHGSADFVLTRDWKEYNLDLAGKDLSKIKTGLVFTVAGNGHPQTIYFDDIQYK